LNSLYPLPISPLVTGRNEIIFLILILNQLVRITSPLTVAGTSAQITQQQQHIVQGQVKIAAPMTGQTLLAPGQRVVTGSPSPVGVSTVGLKSTQGKISKFKKKLLKNFKSVRMVCKRKFLKENIL
jgi:hypothetical protein